jgi:hypothetical protein
MKKAFLDWKALGSPYRSTLSFILNEKTNDHNTKTG